MAFTWDESMSTGVQELDDAHKTIFLWVNKLSDAMKQGKGNDEVLRILDFLGNYSARHFASEEGCMHRHSCPTALANKKAHADFLAYFGKLQEECKTKGVTTSKVLELQQALGNWLRNHIMKIDVALRPCVNKQ
jgi:hemerythrin